MGTNHGYCIRIFVGFRSCDLTQEPATPLVAGCPDQQRSNFVEQMRYVPGPVALICSSSGEARTGMAATAWNSLCADPPMLLVCVNRKASVHDMITQSGKFSVNLLATDDTETVAIFSGQRGVAGKDRFTSGHWTNGPSDQPMLEDAVVGFECELVAGHSYGTHDIFIGKVRHTHRGTGGDPLIYLNGAYCEPRVLNDSK